MTVETTAFTNGKGRDNNNNKEHFSLLATTEQSISNRKYINYKVYVLYYKGKMIKTT